MRIIGNKAIVDFEVLEEFSKAADKAVLDRKFAHIAYANGIFSLHIEGSVASACLRIPVESSAKAFSAGIDAERFLASFKKLYSGDITFQIDKNAVKLIKDNITVKFPIISARSYIDVPEGCSIVGEPKDWLIEHLIASMSSISEMGKKAPTGKFLGVLFETTPQVSRLTKFAQSALYFATCNPIFQQSYRTLIPDVIAAVCKSFLKDVEELILSDTKVSIRLTQGTEVYASIPYDTYPRGYIQSLGLNEGISLIPEEAVGYEFATVNLLDAVDMVATTLGKSESWVSLATIGKSEGKLVWEVGGKSFNKVEVSEKVLSSDGPAVSPFGVNKKRMLRCLSSFGVQVHMYDLNSSTLALVNAQKNEAALLIKALI